MSQLIHLYKPIDTDIWKGRVDHETNTDAFRWHQVIKTIDLTSPESFSAENSKLNICLLGFCSDEGVKRNMGRPGAAKGPESIRKEMANWPANFIDEAILYDAGNVFCENGDLESAQEALSEAVELILQKNMFPILLGGGHEIALGHYQGLLKHFDTNAKKASSPAIINFDAHLDMRPYDKGGSSGTMFYQIADQCKAENRKYSYMCIGTQTYANTRSLFKRADDLGAKYIHAKDISAITYPEILGKIFNFIDNHDHLYITVCSDVLSAAHAPGVSALQPFGLDPDIVLTLIKQLIKSGKVCSLDIAEVSPRFDHDHRTAKLIAVFIYSIINTLIETRNQ